MHACNIPNLHIILYDGFFACYTSTSMRSGNTYVNLFLHVSAAYRGILLETHNSKELQTET